jgi:hypothetical protein
MQKEICYFCSRPLYSNAINTLNRAGEFVRVCGFACSRTAGQAHGAPPPATRPAKNRPKLALPTLTELLTRSRF